MQAVFLALLGCGSLSTFDDFDDIIATRVIIYDYYSNLSYHTPTPNLEIEIDVIHKSQCVLCSCLLDCWVE